MRGQCLKLIRRGDEGQPRLLRDPRRNLDVVALGRVQPRTSSALAAEGLDGSVPCSNLTMVGEDDVGVSASMHRGTELSVMCAVRSTTEAIITPALMLIAAVLPILM